MDYSLENPVFAPQMPGPFAWDTPNRVHMWGWVPLPKRVLPHRLEFLIRNTTAAYLVEYRTGFPFSVVDEEGFLVGRPERPTGTRTTSTSTCTWNAAFAPCITCGPGASATTT